MEIKKQPFGKTVEGVPVFLYTLVNGQGTAALHPAEVKIITYGGIVVSLNVPDRAGQMGDVVLGYDAFQEYEARNPFFGCIVGRYGNRIAHGRFALDGVDYVLAQNNGSNHLHGGLKGFDKKVWQARAMETEGGPALELTYTSPDGEEGYPGNLAVTVVCTLTNDNALRLDYRATTDKATVINLTNHSYFNLSAGAARDVLGHEIMINADLCTPVGAGLIPTGELRSVAGTPLDLRTPVSIGARIDQDDEQLRLGGGYDHNWVINGEPGVLRLAGQVYEPVSGRVMQIYTTEPAMQFYAGNMMPPALPGKGGAVYGRRAGFCLETQHYPDSPNRPHFPSTVLRPGCIYTSTTVYKFSSRAS